MAGENNVHWFRHWEKIRWNYRNRYRRELITFALRLGVCRPTDEERRRQRLVSEDPPSRSNMEAPFDAEKSKTNMMNFSGSASDMMEAMSAAGILVPEAQKVMWNLFTEQTYTPPLLAESYVIGLSFQYIYNIMARLCTSRLLSK